MSGLKLNDFSKRGLWWHGFISFTMRLIQIWFQGLVSKRINTPMHYSDAIMSTMAPKITSLTIVYSTVYSGADHRKHQSSASLAFVRRIHPHKGPVAQKMFPFDDVIMDKNLSRVPLGSFLSMIRSQCCTYHDSWANRSATCICWHLDYVTVYFKWIAGNMTEKVDR